MTPRTYKQMPGLEVVIEAPAWQAVEVEALVHQACAVALDHLGLAAEAADMTVLACDDARIALLNGDFRDKPQPTNVLSWPAEERGADVAGGQPKPVHADPDGTLGLGDIALAYETISREAGDAGKPFADHLTHLVVHGVLHLLGYDHQTEPDAVLMERLEVEILGKLGLDDPY